MKNKSLAMLSPLCLCLYAASSRAALEPFTLGASETIKHESNISHQPDQDKVGDWISTTEFTAALDQAVGRDKLVANAGVNYSGYKHRNDLDNWGYRAGAEFDWNTVGDLAGAFGADASRKRYVYGATDLPLGTDPNAPPASTTELNMQTDSHVFGRFELGGNARWQVFGGADASQRRFSASDFKGDDERQWSANFGTRYSTSPDLSFGLVANYTRGDYPDAVFAFFGTTPIRQDSKFRTRSINATTRLKATGNSAFDASLGFTSESSDVLTKDSRFLNGSLNWTWTPPSHFTVALGLKRSSDVDLTSTGLNTGTLGSNNLNGVSVNNVALLDVTYAVTAKINLDANASYAQRKYSDVRQPTPPDLAGTLNTTSFSLYAHYKPTRNSDLSCGGGREVRRANAAIANLLPSYSDNTVQCIASIKFD